MHRLAGMITGHEPQPAGIQHVQSELKQLIEEERVMRTSVTALTKKDFRA